MQIDRKELLDQLDQVKPATRDNETTPQSDCFLFQDGSICTFNDEILIRMPCCLKAEGAIKAAPLHHLLSKATEDVLTFQQSEGVFLLAGKRNRAGLTVEAEIKSPAASIELPTTWARLPANFLDGLKFCMFSASTDMSRPALTGIHVFGDIAESCDNFRLTRFTMEAGVGKPLLIPATAAAILIKYPVTRYGLTKGWAHFKAKELIFSCRVGEEKYPDITPLLKVEGEKVKVPEKIREALDRASVFTESEFDQDRKIKISFKPDRMIVEGKNVNGWYQEKLAMKYDGDELTFQIHPAFLQEMVSIMDEVVVGENKLKIKGKGFVHVVSLIADDTKED